MSFPLLDFSTHPAAVISKRSGGRRFCRFLKRSPREWDPFSGPLLSTFQVSLPRLEKQGGWEGPPPPAQSWQKRSALGSVGTERGGVPGWGVVKPALLGLRI